MKYQLKYFLASVFLLGAIFSASAQTQPWIAPQGWAVKKNPIVGNAASIQAGKNTYRNLCIACHGESGKGNGSLAINFTPRPADHTSKKVQQQKDGELFYKIITGRNAMPNFRATFSDNDIWNVINFIRTLAPAELSAPPKPVVKTVSVAPTASTVVTSQKKNTQQNILPNNNTKTVSPSDTNKHTSLVKTDSIAHQLNTAELKMNTPPAIDNTIKSVTTKQDSVIPETSAQIPDSTAQTNSSEGDSEERRKFLFTGSADVDVNVDGKKFNSSGIALEFMPILLWKPSKNLLFESHFHIMAGSGVL
ncbi:MAG TPA: cytochrome c, partial [Bacteroidia bacterium]